MSNPHEDLATRELRKAWKHATRAFNTVQNNNEHVHSLHGIALVVATISQQLEFRETMMNPGAGTPQQEITELRTDAEQLRVENSRLHNECSALAESDGMLREQLRGQQIGLASVSAALEQANKENELLKTEIRTAQYERDQSRNTVDQLTKALAMLNDACTE